MSTYLGRLKSVLAENTPTPVTDKTDGSPFVSSVGDEGRHILRERLGTARTAHTPYPDIPDEWSDAIDRLPSQPCPAAESAERWARACRGV
jgi:hypothetical protein